MNKEQKKQILRKSRDSIFNKEDKLRALLRKQDRIVTKANLEGYSQPLRIEIKKNSVGIAKKTKELQLLKNKHDKLRNRFLCRGFQKKNKED
jgi:cell division protein FtsI/penicillin-binding protein 2